MLKTRRAATDIEVWPILQRRLSLPSGIDRVTLHFTVNLMEYTFDGGDSIHTILQNEADELWKELQTVIDLPDGIRDLAMLIQPNCEIEYESHGIALLREQADADIKTKGIHMDFSAALTHLKAGHKLKRTNWNAPNQHVCLLDNWQTGLPEPQVIASIFALKNAKGVMVSWVPSTGDLLANDWEIVT